MSARTLIIALALALLAAPAVAHAQDRTLDRVQNLIATGRLTEARNTLTQWERTHADPASNAASDDRARALFLAGSLSTDATEAENTFLGVVLSYPSSPVAAEALLRLGQGRYTAGDHQRAIEYLERLRSDYPRSPQRETGLLWLARARLAAGDAATACGIARQSLFGTINDNVRTLIELERDRACAQSGGVANDAPEERRRDDTRPVRVLDGNPAVSVDSGASGVTPPAPVREQPSEQPVRRASPLPDLGIAVDENVRSPEPVAPTGNATIAVPAPTGSATADVSAETDARATDTRSTAAQTTRNAAAAGPEFAVQTAAFGERRPAETIAAELRAKGFEARIVQVPGSAYYRVRYGAFATSGDAAAAALRIRDAGFATLIVNDVRLERKP